MLYTCAYNSDLNNALVAVFHYGEAIPDPLPPGVKLVFFAGAVPDLSRHVWNSTMLRFDPKAVLTKLQFRRLFTQAEREAIDEFNLVFESHPALTADQKKAIRTGLEDYRMAEEIDLKDPGTAAMLGLYEAVGLLAPGRAAEILA